MSNRNLHMELTFSNDGGKVFIFKNSVVSIENGIDDGATVTTINGCYHVKENTEKVLEMFYTR